MSKRAVQSENTHVNAMTEVGRGGDAAQSCSFAWLGNMRELGTPRFDTHRLWAVVLVQGAIAIVSLV